MKSCWTILACLGIALLWASCRPLYTPNPVNIPLFSQGEEVHGSLAVGSNGYNLQLAWAPVEHLGLMLNANTYSVYTDSVFVRRFRHQYVEAGAGYWTRLNKYLRQEIYVGLGTGANGEDPIRYFYNRLFIQPTIGLSRRYFDLGFAPRITFANHYATENTGGRSEFTDEAIFFEPAAVFRAGYDQIKFQFQAHRSFALGGAPFTYQNWTFGFGIHITLGKDFDRYNYSYE